MSGKVIKETDVELSKAYLDGFFSGQELEKAKQVKQKAFFKSICKLADEAKEVTTLAGGKYKRVVLNFSKEVLEELKEWSEKEWIA